MHYHTSIQADWWEGRYRIYVLCKHMCIKRTKRYKELHLHYTAIMERHKGARKRKTMIDNDLQADSLSGFNKNVE